MPEIKIESHAARSIEKLEVFILIHPGLPVSCQ
jgi:hypothetical protein